MTDPWINSLVTNLCQEHLDGLPDLMCPVSYLGFLTDKEVQSLQDTMFCAVSLSYFLLHDFITIFNIFLRLY